MQTPYISDHFSYSEVISSATATAHGIDNSAFITPELLTTISRTAVNMEKIRSVLGNIPLHIDSWYRCPELNKAVGSKPTSQHIKGEAVDFICPDFGTPLEIAKAIISSQYLIRFDQLIMEHSWVHISFCSPNSTPRGEVLSLINGGMYAHGLTNINGESYA